jgi:hypothetical protein
LIIENDSDLSALEHRVDELWADLAARAER